MRRRFAKEVVSIFRFFAAEASSNQRGKEGEEGGEREKRERKRGRRTMNLSLLIERIDLIIIHLKKANLAFFWIGRGANGGRVDG